MYRFISFVIVFVLMSCDVFLSAQEKPSYTKIDTSTYNAYLRKDWETVIKNGRLGIKNDIDYYFLRMRMGIAFYERKNYRRAIIHFKKASELNKNGELLPEYLYYSYTFSGRYPDARFLSSGMTMTELTNNNLTQKNKVYGGVYFQYLWNPHSTSYENYPRPVDPLRDGTQIVLNYMTKLYGELNIEAGRRVNLWLAYTFLNQNRFYYKQESGTITALNQHRLYQNQIYLGSQILVGNGWNLSAAYHLAAGLTPNYYSSMAGPGSGRILVLPSYKFKDHIFHISLNKDVPYFNFGWTSSISRIQNQHYFQGGFSLAFYPLGNLNLYALNTMYFLAEFQNLYENTRRILLESTLGWKVAPFLWMEIYGSWGDHTHFAVSSGRVIYNGPDRITDQWGGSFIFPFSKYSARIFINYYFTRSDSFFSDGLYDASTYNTIPIESHSIRGGISWTF